MSEQTQALVEDLRARLRATLRRISLADLAYGLVLSAALLSATWVLLVAIEAGFWLGVTPRTVLFWVCLVAAAGLTGYFVVWPLLRLLGVLPGLPEESVAARIGTRYPEVSDRLLNLLQLTEGRHSDAPSPFLDGAVRMLGEQVKTVPFENVEDFHRVRRTARWAVVPVLALIVFVTAAPSTFVDASKRLLAPGTTFQRPAPFQLSVSPGDVDLVKGEPLTIEVQAVGLERPAEVRLALNQQGEERVEQVVLRPDSTGAFRHVVPNVRTSLRYQVQSAPVQTRWYEATVTERPIVRGLQVALNFPDYTGIPDQRLDANVGDVTALPGTAVSVDVGVAGRNVAEAFVEFDDGRLDTLTLQGQAARGTFDLRREGTYRILLRNADGVTNRDPITYSLKLLQDAAPSIVLLEPEPLAELDETLRAPLRMRLRDDFGFYRLRLGYRLAASRFGTPDSTFSYIALPLDEPGQLDQELLYPWSLSATTPLDPVPGDVIEYFVQVWDNDAISGFKSARSAVHQLRLPSLAEKYEELDETQEETNDDIESMLEESREVREQFEELRDELRRKPEADWEDARQLEQLKERQEQLDRRAEELSRQMEEMTRQMEKNDLVSQETLEKYEELQKVVEEVQSPELMEALKQLEQAMQDMNLQQMQQSLENFEFSEQQYQERLERTLELFKRLRVQQGLEELAERAQNLAQEQERLAEETEALQKDEQPDGEEASSDEADEQDPSDSDQDARDEDQQNASENEDEQGREAPSEEPSAEPRNEALAREQERSAEEMEQLEEKMEQLREQMEELGNTPQEKMQQLQEQTRQQQMPEQMRQNAQQLQQQQLQDAQQGQQQMQQQLQQMQQQLQQMQQGMQSQQSQINMAALRRALRDVLDLSQDQEALRKELLALSPESPQLRTSAQQQVELAEGLSTVADTLQRLAREIPEMNRAIQQRTGEALREMGTATETMTERNAAQASSYQKTAMMQLNELALMLSELLDQMQSGSGSGGGMSMQQMMQQMQNMSQQQQQLNQQIQQMLNDMQGNRLTQDSQERLRQMAAQQERIRQQLKQLSRDRNARGELLGDLERIAEQMEETIEELQRRGPDRRTVQRQQQILTRLLQSTRSLQQRGEEEKRQGRTGDDVQRDSPTDLTPSEQADQLRRDLIRALESGYAPDYEDLIRRYFELLQQSGSSD